MERDSRPIIFWGLIAAGAGVALWFSTAQGSAQGRAAMPRRPVRGDQPVRRSGRLEPAISIREAAAAPAAAFERYGRLIRRNPFAPNLPARSDAVDDATDATFVGPPLPPNFVVPKPQPGAPAAPPDPFKDLVYTGTVTIGDVTYAVVEDKTTKRGQYLGLEETLQGGTVIGITQGTLLILIDGQTRSLQKSSAFNATPLNAVAATPAPGAATPGGAPPAGSAKPGAASGPGAPAQPAPGPRPSGPPVPATLSTPVAAPPGVVSEVILRK